jgi:hypothetical protein
LPIECSAVDEDFEVQAVVAQQDALRRLGRAAPAGELARRRERRGPGRSSGERRARRLSML